MNRIRVKMVVSVWIPSIATRADVPVSSRALTASTVCDTQGCANVQNCGFLHVYLQKGSSGRFSIMVHFTLSFLADIDECSVLEQCSNGGTCVNTHGGFHCVCIDGWTGARCEEGQFSSSLINLMSMMFSAFVE